MEPDVWPIHRPVQSNGTNVCTDIEHDGVGRSFERLIEAIDENLSEQQVGLIARAVVPDEAVAKLQWLRERSLIFFFQPKRCAVLEVVLVPHHIPGRCLSSLAKMFFGMRAWTPRTMSTTWVTRKLTAMLQRA